MTYAQELSLTVFISIVFMSAVAAAFWAGGKIQGKLHRRFACCLEDLREDQRVCAGFYVGLFFVLSFVLWISLLCAVFGLRQLLEAAIWG